MTYLATAIERRRCRGTRKDGNPCGAWALWGHPDQVCHSHSGRRHIGPMTLNRTSVAAHFIPRMGPVSFGCRFIVVAVLTSAVVAAIFGVPSAASAAPVRRSDDVSPGSYLEQLLDEINAGRARADTAPLAYAAGSANDAVGQYLSELTPLMVAAGACFHGPGDAARSAWNYVADAGLGGEARGEILACPAPGHYWTAKAVADAWWDSPDHWRILYGDPEVNAVACGAYDARSSGRAFRVVACVTYRR